MSVLFISDLHLQAERPDITRAFLRFVRQRAIHAEALYILGDFFEVWIGDDGMDDYQRDIARALHHLSQHGVKLYLMHGNRDFMIGRRFCREAGCTLLDEGTVIELHGERVMLMHGDSLCTRDESYQRLRRRLRNPLIKFLLGNLPLSRRQQLARKLRDTSRMHTRCKSTEITDITEELVPEVMKDAGVTTLIHGHTHRPAIHELRAGGKPARRIVLGDWDRGLGWALEVSEQGWDLASFPLHDAGS